jgi:hypothetical protein
VTNVNNEGNRIMKKTTKSKAAVGAAAVALLMTCAPATWAAKPGTGGIFATTCDAVSYGYPREAVAINAPSGTTMISFSFWRQRSVYDAYMADPVNYFLPPGYAQGGTDFDRRDGWWMFSTEPSEVVVAQALNRKGVVLATAMDYCILAG